MTAPSDDQSPTKQNWWAIAAAFLIAFVLGSGVTAWRSGHTDATSKRDLLARDLFASHLRALAAASPVDVASSDRNTVKPWFAGKVGQSPPVRDLSSEGFPLRGGRVDYVGERRVPVLVYAHGQHTIDVFVLPVRKSNVELPQMEMRGYRLVTVRTGPQRMWVVADLDEPEFMRFARLLSSESS